MEELIYISVRLLCLIYILYKVWGWRGKVDEICRLLYKKSPVKNGAKESPVVPLTKIGEADVMGKTRFVYLDENAGKTIAPYMCQPLESDYIGEDKDVSDEEVECKLSLEEMKMLKQEQEELDEISPEVDAISQVVTPADLSNAGDVLLKLNDADKDEGKAFHAARTLFAIRHTYLFDIFTSQVENTETINNLMEEYLDENGNPLPQKKETKRHIHAWQNLL